MSTYAVYENDGALDMRAFTVMGINAKPNSDSPIGYFGTGLKMAVAILARNNCDMRVQDGRGNEYILRSNADNFRDKEFTMLSLFNVKTEETLTLPFTTELAKNWSMWMAMREFECNMRDEGGDFSIQNEVPLQTPGKVRIIILGDAYMNAVSTMRTQVFFDLATKHSKIEEYESDIATREPLQVVLNRPSGTLFYRGIAVYQLPEGRQFANTYNVQRTLDLTEDRTVKYTWVLNSLLEHVFATADNSFRNTIIGRNTAYEWGMYGDIGDGNYTDEAKTHLKESFTSGKFIGNHIHARVMRWITQDEMKKSRTLNVSDTEMFEMAVNNLIDMGYSVDEFPVVQVQTLPGNGLGQALEGKMYISAMNYEHGLECLMATILEEWTHIRYNYHDMTREMQDHFVRQTIVQGMRRLRRMHGKKEE